MLHPSYSDLMNIANSEVEQGELPVVNSRYSIVLATAKGRDRLLPDLHLWQKIHPVPNLCRLQLKNWHPVLSKLMQKKRKMTKNNSIQRLPAGIGWLFFILLDKRLFE